jgi:Fur family ferric uptake transcriptional regulator
MTDGSSRAGALDLAREALRARGMRWTPQRRALLELLFESNGHVTGAELLDKARARDPETQPSTVYRTLDAIEEVGLVVHSHGRDGREEYHVLATQQHGHLTCNTCGGMWELSPDELDELTGSLTDTRGFVVDVSHVTLSGECGTCRGGEGNRIAVAPPAPH